MDSLGWPSQLARLNVTGPEGGEPDFNLPSAVCFWTNQFYGTGPQVGCFLGGKSHGKKALLQDQPKIDQKAFSGKERENPPQGQLELPVGGTLSFPLPCLD